MFNIRVGPSTHSFTVTLWNNQSLLKDGLWKIPFELKLDHSLCGSKSPPKFPGKNLAL